MKVFPKEENVSNVLKIKVGVGDHPGRESDLQKKGSVNSALRMIGSCSKGNYLCCVGGQLPT